MRYLENYGIRILFVSTYFVINLHLKKVWLDNKPNTRPLDDSSKEAGTQKKAHTKSHDPFKLIQPQTNRFPFKTPTTKNRYVNHHLYNYITLCISPSTQPMNSFLPLHFAHWWRSSLTRGFAKRLTLLGDKFFPSPVYRGNSPAKFD